MDFHLIVVRSFGPYSKGDLVSDATTIATILSGENAHDVVRVNTPIMEG